MKKITFHTLAEAEVIEAALYYEERSQGLGLSFLMEVETAVAAVADNPESYQIIGDEIRRKPLRRFPYSLLYVVEPDRIRITAVAHQKRRPDYWRSRL